MGTAANVLVGVGTLSIKYPIGGSYVEAGYTEDGVSMEYNPTEEDIMVEETTVALDRVITKEEVKFTCNMAESSLVNMDKAIAGSVLAGSVITIGGGINKKMSVKVVGKNPAGFNRTLEIPLATATGTVGMSYKKGGKTVVPVTFAALYNNGTVFTITDAAS